MKFPAAAILLGAAALFSAPPASAQGFDAPKFQQFFATDAHRTPLTQAIGRLPPTIFQPCPSLKSAGPNVLVYQPITYAADGKPKGGAWKEEYVVSGCGNDKQLNFVFTASTQEEIKVISALPGTTRAALTLQRDGLQYAYTGTVLYAKDCKSFVVTDTRFNDFGVAAAIAKPGMADPGPNDPHRPWWESWTVLACGRTFNVPIAFMPTRDRPGTDILVSSGAVTEVK